MQKEGFRRSLLPRIFKGSFIVILDDPGADKLDELLFVAGFDLFGRESNSGHIDERQVLSPLRQENATIKCDGRDQGITLEQL